MRRKWKDVAGFLIAALVLSGPAVLLLSALGDGQMILSVGSRGVSTTYGALVALVAVALIGLAAAIRWVAAGFHRRRED